MTTTGCDLRHDTGCEMCGTALTGRQTRYCSRVCAKGFRNNHRWTNARQTARAAAAWYECAKCGFLFQIEFINVNHITPCLGKHGVFGCHHHQANLEVLCSNYDGSCHGIETARQRAEGELKTAR